MVRVVQMGLGPIGKAIAARVLGDHGLKLVGAVDPDPGMLGQDVGTLLGGAHAGVEIVGSMEMALRGANADLVLHATGSFLAEIVLQLRPLLTRGLHVISTCEELAYPFYRHPALARELDAAGRRAGVVLLGSGVNPGFVMDKLVATAMSVCDAVGEVKVVRTVDASTRRESFQRKIGAGLTPDAFDERVRGGRLGHVGLAESAQMLADVMGLGPDRRLEETLRPVIAKKAVETAFLSVEPGQVAGIDQTATIFVDNKRCVHMTLQMFVGAERPYDGLSIDGSPPLQLEFGSGVPGDAGTVNVVIDCAHLVSSLAPGLRTMLDVPLRPALGAGPV